MNAPDKSSPNAAIASIEHWIGGRIAPGQSGRRADVFNPATGAVTGKVALANSSEVDAAVAAAHKAFPAWADMPPIRRG
jgi:malonate-semialdehyde dehydrogenase (acetylating) / methylmalonate-semialdehyde dehydrogenase